MDKRRLMVIAAAALMLTACGNHHGGSSNSSMAPTDFTSYVGGAVTMQSADSAPVQTGSLGNLGLDNAQAFANVQFTGGDPLPAGTYSAAVACANAGSSACSPGLH